MGLNAQKVGRLAEMGQSQASIV